ncbi:MAG: hypothetical protein JWL90_601 [Chthoniobacteraceae bacterium]|nr:hypothetical protein [Chthoniobacteraceae bacterium]
MDRLVQSTTIRPVGRVTAIKPLSLWRLSGVSVPLSLTSPLLASPLSLASPSAGWPGVGIRTDILGAGAKLRLPSALENQSVLTGLGVASPEGNALLSFTGGMGQAVNVDSKNKVSIVAPNAGKMASSYRL